MYKQLRFLFFALLVSFAAAAQCPTTCTYQFALTDSYGDGWNDATMNVVQDGVVVATIGTNFTDGTAAYDYVTLCEGATFELFWNVPGTFPNEVGVTVIAQSQTAIFNLPFNSEAITGLIYSETVACSGGCFAPTMLSVNATSDQAYFSWNGASTSYEVLVQSAFDPAPDAATSGVSVTAEFYLTDPLTIGVSYAFYVRGTCADDNFTEWSGPVYQVIPCATPDSLTVNTIVSDGATFNWQGSTANYQVGVAPGYWLYAPDDIVWENVSDTTFSASGLTTNQIHTFFVRSICGDVAGYTIYLSFTPTTPTIPVTAVPATTDFPSLVTSLLDNGCIDAAGVTASTGTNFGSVNGIGYFSNMNPAFPLSSGIVLSTGDVTKIGGPNVANLGDGTSLWPGDVELEAIIAAAIGQPMYSHNASILEFDFTTENAFMSFNFLFASEEYGTFQCTYADAFAFLLTDLETGVTTNLAVVPGSTTPVSVVTIRDDANNQGCDSQNADYFNSYTDPTVVNGSPIEFNGLTEVMTASSDLIPNHPYHIKLVIADRSDDIYDSAVFIEAGSFTSGPPQCSDKLELVAFVDENANGVKDLGEVPFTFGSFDVSVNDGASAQIYSPIGVHGIWPDAPTDSFDLGYAVSSEYQPYYTFSGSAYADITLPLGGGTQTYYFPVTLTNPYSDVSVTITPQIPPRPGMSYTNKILLQNFGVEAASGTLTFTKDALTTVTEMPSGAVATTYGFALAYTGLQPYETRIYYVTLLAQDVPAVNIDDLLTTTASVTAANDADPLNNEFSNTEVVVASYDPNTVTEAHGREIPFNTFETGEYLYYTIRFQNTGTAHAFNVRVESTLDAQIDPESLLMLGASHDYWLERNGNQLIWHFDYIMLPGQLESDELSRGSLTFKVRLNPGFAVGTIIPSVADIYFDNNAAVTTNTWETEFTAPLATVDTQKDTFVIYPNPAGDSFTVSLGNSGSLQSVGIHDLLGKKILERQVSGQPALEIDSAPLATGVYFVEVITQDNRRMVKKLMVK